MSPTRAPLRSTGRPPSSDPVAVTATVRVGDTVRSPPTTPQRGARAAQAAAKPSATPSRNATGRSAGGATASEIDGSASLTEIRAGSTTTLVAGTRPNVVSTTRVAAPVPASTRIQSTPDTV